jgi:hypothetical protein
MSSSLHLPEAGNFQHLRKSSHGASPRLVAARPLRGSFLVLCIGETKPKSERFFTNTSVKAGQHYKTSSLLAHTGNFSYSTLPIGLSHVADACIDNIRVAAPWSLFGAAICTYRSIRCSLGITFNEAETNTELENMHRHRRPVYDLLGMKYDHNNASVHLADKTSRRINDVTITHVEGATATLSELLRVLGLFIFAKKNAQQQ